jgi:hypothetical protein
MCRKQCAYGTNSYHSVERVNIRLADNALIGRYRTSEYLEFSCSQTVFYKVGQRDTSFSWTTANITWHSDRLPFSCILDTTVNMWLVRFLQQWRFIFWSYYLLYSIFWELCNLVLKVPPFTDDLFQCSVLLSAKMCKFRIFKYAITTSAC